MQMVTEAMGGLSRYMADSKILTVVLGALLYLLFGWRALHREQEKKLILYTLILTGMAVYPVTAACMMMYQTRFYEYGWIWSMVPVTAFTAYGGTVIIWRELVKKRSVLSREGEKKIYGKLRLAGGLLGAAVMFFLCGNLGQHQTASQEELAAAGDTREILKYLAEQSQDGNNVSGVMLWAPREIMEQVRRQTGEVVLLYGRDMWENKAAAYDYETYDPQVTSMYLLMEELKDLDSDEALPEDCLCEAVNRGVNVLVFPGGAKGRIQAALLELERSDVSLHMESADVGDYLVLTLD